MIIDITIILDVCFEQKRKIELFKKQKKWKFRYVLLFPKFCSVFKSFLPLDAVRVESVKLMRYVCGILLVYLYKIFSKQEF